MQPLKEPTNMQKINWNQFKLKNPDANSAFEDLCYYIFCRKHEVNEGALSEHSQAGIETYPIKDRKTNKWYGFQVKFFDGVPNYNLIKNSIEIACRKKKERYYENLDVVEIYLKKLTRNRKKTEIENLAKKQSIKIEWIAGRKFESILNQPQNSDLGQVYFGLGNEVGFISKNFKPTFVNILKSAEYIRLPFLLGRPEIRYDELIKNVFKEKANLILVTGSPGSGKTILMHDLAWRFGGRDKKNEKEAKKLWSKIGLPMLVNLKDCFEERLENVIRLRQEEFGLRNTSLGFVYIFDGLDELDQEKADGVLYDILQLSGDRNTKKIVVSSRSGNQNLHLLFSYFPSIKANHYKISKLTEKNIKTYFQAIGHQNKIKKLSSLLKENPNFVKDIEDALLLKLFWESIGKLDKNSSIIDLFEQRIDYLLDHPIHKKNIEKLNLLDPKKESLIELNKGIAYKLHRDFQFRFPKKDIQRIIEQSLPKLNYRDINTIFDYLCSQFFDDGGISRLGDSSDQSFTYQHRRYQEFFFVKKLKELYEQDRGVLREENILANHEFIEKLLIPYLKREYIKESNLPRILETNLFQIYYKWDEENEIYSSRDLVIALSKLNADIFFALLSDQDLGIENKIDINPFSIATFWQAGKKEFAESLLNELKKRKKEWRKEGDKGREIIDEIIWKYWQSHLYILINISKHKISDIFKKYIKENYVQFSEEERFPSYGESGKEKLLKSFFRAVLQSCPNKLTSFIGNFDDYELLSFLEVLSELEYIPLFLRKKLFHREIRDRLKKYEGKTKDKTFIILFYKTILQIKIPRDHLGFIDKSLSEIINKDRYFDWKRNCEKYAILFYVKSRNKKRPKNQKTKKPKYDLPKYYSDLELYAMLYADLIRILMGKIKSIDKVIIEYIEYLDTHECMYPHNYLKYEISVLWGLIFSFAQKKDLNVTKDRFLSNANEILKFTFYLTISQRNAELFHNIVNEQEIDEETKQLDKWDEDYQSLISNFLVFSELYAVINPHKSVLYANKALTEGLVRHGYHKDIVVSVGLIDTFSVLWRNHFLHIDELRKVSEDLMELIFRVLDVTDGDHTAWASNRLIEEVAKYDISQAEKLKEKLKKERGIYNAIVTIILLAKIKNCYSLDEIYKGIEEYKKRYGYKTKPFADYYEQKFKIYLAITQNYFYDKKERREAFDKAYGQIDEILKHEIDYYLRDYDFKEEKELFRSLCKKYKKEYKIPEEKKSDSDYKSDRKKIKEQDFVREIKKVKSKSQIKTLFKKLNDYKYDIVLRKKKSWEVLFDKTLQVYGNIEPILDYLKNQNYPSYMGVWSANSNMLYNLVSSALKNKKTKGEILNYIYAYSGHGGFSNMAMVYEELEDKKMCVEIFREFYTFCKFLLY